VLKLVYVPVLSKKCGEADPMIFFKYMFTGTIDSNLFVTK
jgi:hypothetical protein